MYFNDPRLVPGAGVTAPAPYMGQQPPMDFGQMAQMTANAGLQHMPEVQHPSMGALDRLRNMSREKREMIGGMIGGAGLTLGGGGGQQQVPMAPPPPMAPIQGQGMQGPAYDYLQQLRQQTGLLGGF